MRGGWSFALPGDFCLQFARRWYVAGGGCSRRQWRQWRQQQSSPFHPGLLFCRSAAASGNGSNEKHPDRMF